MKKYIVRWTQILQENFEVEANSEEEACEIVLNGECGDVEEIVSNKAKVVKVIEDE